MGNILQEKHPAVVEWHENGQMSYEFVANEGLDLEKFWDENGEPVEKDYLWTKNFGAQVVG